MQINQISFLLKRRRDKFSTHTHKVYQGIAPRNTDTQNIHPRFSFYTCTLIVPRKKTDKYGEVIMHITDLTCETGPDWRYFLEILWNIGIFDLELIGTELTELLKENLTDRFFHRVKINCTLLFTWRGSPLRCFSFWLFPWPAIDQLSSFLSSSINLVQYLFIEI